MVRGLSSADADIAQAAGTKGHPSSIACRRFLESILTVCHRVVITANIGSERKRHSSKFFSRWLRNMFAKKKQVYIAPVVIDEFDMGENNPDRVLQKMLMAGDIEGNLMSFQDGQDFIHELFCVSPLLRRGIDRVMAYHDLPPRMTHRKN